MPRPSLGILRRQVVPELRLLTEDAGYMERQLAPLLPRRQTEHMRLASGRVEDAGQHFDRGRLARTIWPYESQYFSRLQGEADVLDCFAFAVVWGDK